MTPQYLYNPSRIFFNDLALAAPSFQEADQGGRRGTRNRSHSFLCLWGHGELGRATAKARGKDPHTKDALVKGYHTCTQVSQVHKGTTSLTLKAAWDSWREKASPAGEVWPGQSRHRCTALGGGVQGELLGSGRGPAVGDSRC